MSFLYPQFLWALTALSIPVIIHLFNFLRPRKVLFTNVRFLRSIKEQTNQSHKLRHLLILLCRLLFLALLVLAFAQPYIADKGVQASEGKKYVSIYVDNSFSMQSETGDGSALDVALRSAEKLVNSYGSNTYFQIFSNDFSGKSQYYYAPEKARDMLAEIKYGNTFRDLASVVKRQASAFRNLHQSGTGGEFFIISDFQRSTLGGLSDLNKIAPDTARRYYLLPVQPEKTANLFIDSVWINKPFVKVNENNLLNVSVFNAGNAEAQGLVLKLFIDDVQVSTASLTVGAGSNALTHFTFSIGSPQAHKCRISMEDRPVIFDNDYYFVLKTAPKIKVMHLYAGNPEYLKNVFGNAELFDLHSYPIGNTDYDYFQKADVIVTEGINTLDAGLREALQKALSDGKSVALFPSPRPDAPSYNNLCGAFGLHPVAAPLSGSPAGAPDTVRNAAGNSLQNPDTKNPFFEGVFESVAANTVLPYAAPALTWNKAGVTLLQYRNGNPFLSEAQAGKGKIYLFAAPPDQGAKGNFAQHALFVPVMYRIGEQSLPGEKRLAYSFRDKSISVPIDSILPDRAYTLNKGSVSIIPAQHAANRALLMELPKTDMEAGWYQLRLNGQTRADLAFNYGSEESRLTNYTPSELQQVFSPFKNFRIFNAENDAAAAASYVQHNRGVPYWKQALIASLLFLLAEVLLIRFWGK